MADRVRDESKDAYKASTDTTSRVYSGALSGGLGSLAGSATGAGAAIGVTKLANALLPGSPLTTGGMIGSTLGLGALALATFSAIEGSVAGHQAKAGAHTDVHTVRRSFKNSAKFQSTTIGAVVGANAGAAAVQALLPGYSLVGGIAGVALGALAGNKIGQTAGTLGGNLLSIPMKRNAGLEGSKYSGKLQADAPPVADQTTSMITPLLDDTPFTEDVMKTVANAKSSIRFETFLLNGDDGKAFADLLIEKKKEGLDVKVILDQSMQKIESARRLLGNENYALGNYLKENGVDYLPYASDKMSGSLTPADHAKVLIVDDEIAYLGGTNIDDSLNRDTNVKIEGPAAKDIAQLFDESWEVTKNPDPNVLGLPGDPVISDPSIKVFSTSPSRSTIKQAIIDNIRDAKDSICIQMFTFTDDDLVDELKQAADRGVDVKLLLCENKEIFHLPTFHAPNLPTALQAKDSGIDVKWYSNPEFPQMHSKHMIFDNKKVMLGSMNAIHNAYRGIHEYYTEIDNSELAQTLTDKFGQDWNEHGQEVKSNLGYRALGAVIEAVDNVIL